MRPSARRITSYNVCYTKLLRIIVNADDFALTDGVSRGIARLMEMGAVTSTSVMTCAEGAKGRVRRHAGTLRGRAGVHLQLTAGKPRLPGALVIV